MENIKLSQNTYKDNIGSMYFKAFRVEDPKFSVKVVEATETNKLDQDTVLVHCEGVIPEVVNEDGVVTDGGLVINLDLWPRNEATKEDLKVLQNGAVLEDMKMRTGYWKNPVSGEVTVGQPKWIAVKVDGKWIELSGAQRKYEE